MTTKDNSDIREWARLREYKIGYAQGKKEAFLLPAESRSFPRHRRTTVLRMRQKTLENDNEALARKALVNDEKLDFTYLCQPPKRYTFEQPKLRSWIEKWSKGKVLNLFAGRTRLDLDEYRVDSNKDMIADWYGDAFDFVSSTNMRFDTVVLDPPYNLRKAREKYGGAYIGSFTKIKNELPRILNKSSRVIILGYDTVGMSKSRGFNKIAICVVCHNGDHNDTLCVCEEMNK